MDYNEPKTRKESKKDSKTKKGEKYSGKHIRIQTSKKN